MGESKNIIEVTTRAHYTVLCARVNKTLSRLKYVYRWYVTSAYVHKVYLCVLCGSENKVPLFPYTTLIDWFL